jgi:hypothetical protein
MDQSQSQSLAADGNGFIISNRGASGAAARRTEGGSARHRAPRARASLARARRVSSRAGSIARGAASDEREREW